jgi:hypothetical protein
MRWECLGHGQLHSQHEKKKDLLMIDMMMMQSRCRQTKVGPAVNACENELGLGAPPAPKKLCQRPASAPPKIKIGKLSPVA